MNAGKYLTATKADEPMNTSTPIWGGAFTEAHNLDAYKFTASIGYDKRLYKYDIAGSCAHAEMLAHIGILTPKEAELIITGLGTIEEKMDRGEFAWNIELEDVHMNIESALVALIGEAGEKLHTARSRNDQVALDMRLWLRDQIDVIGFAIRELQLALIRLGEENMEVVIPGYTHLQRAQPVPAAHHLLAYVEMLDRDYERLQDTRKRTNVCPLGAGAIAGSSLQLDREFVARRLNFVDEQNNPLVTRNSMDAVSDRDFVIEFLSACAGISMHLSRMCEELIVWCSSEFAFIRIGDAFCTGSSLMPQKKNPDIPEIIRGKTGRVYGNLVSLLVTMKGLPLAYNYDMQEDKEAVFDSADTTLHCLTILSKVLDSSTFNKGTCAKAASDPALLATDLVDWLVIRQVPFRQAHHVVGKLVALCTQQGKTLPELTEEEMQQVHPVLDRSALEVFDLTRAIQARTIIGAPSMANIQAEIARWQKKLGDFNAGSAASRQSVQNA